ncbi:MAG: aminopeptidase P family protein [Candidatus Absconditabacterales bacterium]|nr:aminopeptidase P family protein [Candidatus Absconditabacterales bacterium]
MTEKDIEKQFLDHIPSGYTKAFLSIAGFDNLRDSTIASATDRVINTGEVVCIDFGLYGNGVHSDMTRCFFVGDDRFGLRDGYHRIQLVINESLQFIIPGKHNKEFIQDLIDVSKKYGLTEYCLTDLGHGIGWDLHEYPDLYNDDFIFEEGMCFTLEPEYKLNGYFLRYEDIYTIHQGETLLLQSLA